jgi:glycosyltransferase involved in cell wall biosynthesis
MFFSIVIPVYNREKLISEAIKSVLKQSFTSFELILIDNCSTDKTIDIIKSFSDERIILLQNERNFERCYSRNRGIQFSSGEYILLMDSDDLIEINHLQSWYELLCQNISFKEYIHISDKKILKGDFCSIQKNPIFIKNPVCYFFENPVIPGQVCVSGKVLKKYFFKDDYLIFEDAALWMEIALNNKVKFNQINSFIYRLHDENSVNELVNNIFYLRLHSIRLMLKDENIKIHLSNKVIRFSKNACYKGIIRYHKVNSNFKVRIKWVLLSIFLYPEYNFKNKLLIFLDCFPIFSRTLALHKKNIY